MTCDRKGRPALSRSGRRAGARHRCGHSAGIAPTARDQGWRRSAFAFRSENRPHPQERGTTLIETCITLDWRSPKDMGGLLSRTAPASGRSHQPTRRRRRSGAPNRWPDSPSTRPMQKRARVRAELAETCTDETEPRGNGGTAGPARGRHDSSCCGEADNDNSVYDHYICESFP